MDTVKSLPIFRLDISRDNLKDHAYWKLGSKKFIDGDVEDCW